MLLLNKIMELEHITKIIDSIDYTKVIDTAREVLSKEFSVAVVGNKKEMDLKIFEQRVLTH